MPCFPPPWWRGGCHIAPLVWAVFSLLLSGWLRWHNPTPSLVTEWQRLVEYIWRCLRSRCCCTPHYGRFSGICTGLPAPRLNVTGNPSRYCRASTWPARFGSLIGTAPFLWWWRMPFARPVLQWWARLPLLHNQCTRWASYRGSQEDC